MAERGRYAKGEAKREQILRAALQTIARNGFGGSTLRDIADSVGLSNAGVLHYFGSKEDLYIEVLRLRDREALTRAADHDESLFTRFVETIQGNAAVPGLVRLYTALASDATDPEHPARPFFHERYGRLRDTIAEQLRQDAAAGIVRGDIEPDHAARTLLAIADGLQSQWLIDPGFDMAEHVEGYLRLLAPA